MYGNLIVGKALYVNDGLTARIRACVARPGLANKLWVEQGVGASVATDLALSSPNRPNRAVSSYRLLCAVIFCCSKI
jgi:hypothetical protein